MVAEAQAQPGFLSRFKVISLDKFLVIALVLGLIFALYGIHWGWVECWNPDQMAFRNLFRRGAYPFEPTNFQKPPFHTYFNFFLSRYPFGLLGRVAQKVFGDSSFLATVMLIWSRLLTVGLFLGSIALTFRITNRFFGLVPARIVALIFATSAGFIVESHYLTADTPLVFWMLLAFAFAQNVALEGRMRDYALAGFFTGIATATKYNGLGVGITIVAAHLLFAKPRTWDSWKSTIFSKKLFVGLSMVVGGFLVGNPFAVITFSKFIAGFWYNYKVAPVYDGTAANQTSYLEFFALFPDLIGLPAFIIFGIAFLFVFYFLFTEKDGEVAKKGILLLLSAFLLYYYKFGDFPRLEVRFVMPIVPFWLMLSGAFWQRLKGQKTAIVACLVVLLSYNAVSSFYVGKRFTEDPRMQAQAWVQANIPAKSVVESSAYTPNWNALQGVEIEDIRMPFITGRRKLFEETFKDDPWMLSMVRQREGTEQQEQEKLQWYSIDALAKRQPDYIIAGSLYYNRFSQDAFAQLYPSVKQFFSDLPQVSSYKVGFDRASEKSPFWAYPRDIDWVDNRITILVKDG
jgi:4-amino-4-deoxy-L-arabinose transferase-like glycosyltransferase